MINQVKNLSVIEKDRSDGGPISICGLSPNVKHLKQGKYGRRLWNSVGEYLQCCCFDIITVMTKSSAILEIQGVKEIRRRSFFKSLIHGFLLGIGVTSASFHTLGSRCSLKEEFKIVVIGYARKSACSFSNQLGILSGPQAFAGFNLHNILKTGCSVTTKNTGQTSSKGSGARGFA